MACRLINRPKDGKEVTSKTWDALYKHTNNNEKEADRLYNQLLTPEFTNWFGDWYNDPGGDNVSKVVNEDGEPLVVYHGTEHGDFSVFKTTGSKDSIGRLGAMAGSLRAAQLKANDPASYDYLHPDQRPATPEGSRIMPLFLNIKSPIESTSLDDAFEIKTLGKNDGLIIQGLARDENGRLVKTGYGTEYLVKNAEQLKSIENTGAFSEANSNIYFNTKPIEKQTLPQAMQSVGATWWNKRTKQTEEKVVSPLEARYLTNFLNTNTKFTFQTVIFNNDSAVVRVKNTEQQREVDRTEANKNEQLLASILERMPKKLGINYQIISPDKAIAILAKRGISRTAQSLESAFYDGDKVYLVEGKYSLEDPIHEYAHPFVDALKNDNPELFDRLYNRLINSPDGMRILADVEAANYPEGLKAKEIMVRAITDKALGRLASLKSQSVVDSIMRYIKKLLRDIFGISLSKLSYDTTLQELADILVSNEPINIESAKQMPYEGVQFNRELGESDPEWDEMISHQGTPTQSQKETLEQYETMRGIIKLSEDGEHYEHLDKDTGNITQLIRASKYIEEMPGPMGQENYYKFQGQTKDELLYEDNRQWGNQVDDILTGVLMGDSLEQVKERYADGRAERLSAGSEASISNEVIEQLFDIFTELKAEYPDSIIINQQPLYNLEKGVAGTADIIVVHKDGTSDILDLKTSVHPTEKPYEKEAIRNGEVVKVTTGYTKRFPNNVAPTSASKKDKHQAQNSVYTGMGQSQGILISAQGKTIHIHLKETSDGLVTDVVREKDQDQAQMQKVILEFNEDAQFAGQSVRSIETSKGYNRVMIKIMNALKTKQSELARRNNKAGEYAMAKLLEDMNGITFASSVATMVNETHKTFLGDPDGTWKGWFDKIATVVKDANEEKIDSEKALKLLSEGKEQIQLYLPVIEEMKNFYNRFYYTDIGKSIPTQVDETSTIGQMKNLMDNMETYVAMINDTLPDMHADILFPYIEGASRQLMKEAKEKKKALDFYKAETKRKNYKEGGLFHKKRMRSQEALEREYRNIYRRATMSKEDFAEMIREGNYENITNIADIMFNPAISSSNEIVAAVALAVKEKFEDARLKSVDFQHEAYEAFKKFKKASGRGSWGVEKFNKGLYKEVKIFKEVEDGKAIYKTEKHFVNNIDRTKYEEAKGEFMAQIDQLAPREKAKALSGWYATNRVNRPVEDEMIVLPNGKKVTILEGTNSILAKKKLHMTPAAYDKWLNRVSSIDGGITTFQVAELTMPNPSLYSNEVEMQGIKNDAAMNEYYNFLVANYFDAQKNLPPMNQPGYRLPSVVKGDLDRLQDSDGGIANYFQYKKDSTFKFHSEDLEDYGHTDAKVIPVVYAQSMDAKDVSNDLISSVMMFTDAANLYDARNQMAPITDSVLEQIEGSAPIKLDNQGEGVIAKHAKSLGLENTFAKWQKDYGNNNVAKLLGGFISMQIYGKHKKEEKWGNLDVAKVGDAMIKAGSVTQIALDGILGAANLLNAQAQGAIEAAAGQFFNKTDWAKANAQYMAHSGDFIRDATKPIKKTLIGQLIDLYDPIQGTARDQYGRKISRSSLKRATSTSTMYMNMSMGEHNVQVTGMLAMLNSKKVRDNNGNEVPLKDAYELDSKGKIRIKAGYDLSSVGKMSANGLVASDVRNTLHSINKSLHGVYNDFDAPLIQQHVLGRLLMMYRKFIVPGMKRRWQGYSVNYESGEVKEGYYYTFFKQMNRDFLKLMKAMAPFTSAEDLGLTPLELANLRRFTVEACVILTTIALVAIFKGMYEGASDDREKWKWSYPLYLAMRLQSELQFYSNPRDTIRLMQSPSATYGLVLKVSKLMGSVFGDAWSVGTGQDIGRYKRDTGMADKGDSKSWIYFLKLLGLNGRQTDPRDALKMLEMQTGG